MCLRSSNFGAVLLIKINAAADPKLFDLGSFTELGVPRDLAKIFESEELIKWRSFRESENSRYVSLVLPRVLMRLPYGPNTVPVEGVGFAEDTDGRELHAANEENENRDGWNAHRIKVVAVNEFERKHHHDAERA